MLSKMGASHPMVVQPLVGPYPLQMSSWSSTRFASMPSVTALFETVVLVVPWLG